MSVSADTPITFIAGRYNAEQSEWQAVTNGPTATITEALLRTILDAAGEETVDTTGDIDPDVLLRLVGLGPRRAEDASAWLRLVCRWARRRNLRVGFSHGEPME